MALEPKASMKTQNKNAREIENLEEKDNSYGSKNCEAYRLEPEPPYFRICEYEQQLMGGLITNCTCTRYHEPAFERHPNSTVRAPHVVRRNTGFMPRNSKQPIRRCPRGACSRPGESRVK
ncbi:hypothetical protein ACFE04_019829 [Oxalis oulophora]